MLTLKQITIQINKLITYLVGKGISDDQQIAFQRTLSGNLVEITFKGSEHVSFALKNYTYDKIYEHLVQTRAYNAKMLDGALIQMEYAFDDGTLQRHRLAFFPSPHLEEFQNNPNVYLEDEIYADVIAKNIVPFPIRFDYDNREGYHQNLVHPKSHLTLGQYENCRIPVTAPMTPFWFIDFILRNFYHTTFARYTDGLPSQTGSFPESILQAERSIIHIVIPA